jgi:hypothetical protein
MRAVTKKIKITGNIAKRSGIGGYETTQKDVNGKRFFLSIENFA